MTRRLRPQDHESVIQGEILLALAERTRLFRNNIGKARRRNRDGSLGRPVNFGLGKGSGDLVGWVKREGIFLSVEVKSPNGVASDEQIAWAEMVRKDNGIALIVASPTEAVAELDEAMMHWEIWR